MTGRTTPLGAAVARARGPRAVTLIAQHADVSKAYITRIENGVIKEPSPHRLRSLAAALGVSYLDLMRAAGYLTVGDEAKIREA